MPTTKRRNTGRAASPGYQPRKAKGTREGGQFTNKPAPDLAAGGGDGLSLAGGSTMVVGERGGPVSFGGGEVVTGRVQIIDMSKEVEAAPAAAPAAAKWEKPGTRGEATQSARALQSLFSGKWARKRWPGSDGFPEDLTVTQTGPGEYEVGWGPKADDDPLDRDKPTWCRGKLSAEKGFHDFEGNAFVGGSANSPDVVAAYRLLGRGGMGRATTAAEKHMRETLDRVRQIVGAG